MRKLEINFNHILQKVRLTKAVIKELRPDLKNWYELNRAIKYADETKLLRLLKLELNTHNRATFITRLKGRYNSLRSVREGEEIHEGIKDRKAS